MFYLCLALLAAKQALKHVLFVFQVLADIKNATMIVVLSLMSMLDVLALKNAAECTSQRLEQTSEPRVTTVSLSEYFRVVSLTFARGRETVKLLAGT